MPDNLVSAAENAQAIGLDKLFVHNGERIQAICRTLGHKEKPAVDRLLEVEATVHELHEYGESKNQSQH